MPTTMTPKSNKAGKAIGLLRATAQCCTRRPESAQLVRSTNADTLNNAREVGPANTSTTKAQADTCPMNCRNLGTAEKAGDCKPVDSVLAGRQRRETVPEGPPTFVSASHLHDAERMEASTLPAVRVEPALRRDAETVLDEGESLSNGRRKAARALNIRVSSRDLKHLQARAL